MKSKPLRIAAMLVGAASLVMLILVLITGRFELIYAAGPSAHPLFGTAVYAD